MDIDQLLKSASDDQMDMIMMMMQMDKLPDFFGGSNEDTMAAMELSSGGSTSSNFSGMQQILSGSPTFMNPQSNISFSGGGSPVDEPVGPPFFLGQSMSRVDSQGQKHNSMAAMREMIFRIAAMQPVHIDPESVKPPKRRNVKISKDPQSVAARHRREKISERIRILQRLVPGGTKMDTASMLDEAIHYVKFLKTQVQNLERAAANRPASGGGLGFPVAMSSGSYVNMAKGYLIPAQNVHNYADA